MNRGSKSDFYTKKAQKEGYKARSVYKLMEIDQKNSLIKKNDNVLDIGAAPGSWTQYALKKGAKVTAVDLKEIDLKAKTLKIIQGDFTNENVEQEISGQGPFDLIISDAAPATSGNRTVDTARSEALVEEILFLAKRYLKSKGTLLIKIFQGSNQQEIRQNFKNDFNQVRFYKPAACRKDSFEHYLLAQDKK